MDRTILDLWAEIGSGSYWSDLLTSNPGIFCPFDHRWPQPGFVGSDYLGSNQRVAIIAQNPRASNTSRAEAADRVMFELIREHSATRSRDSLDALFEMMREFMLGTHYKPAWKPVTAIRRHLYLELDDIAYLNLIPLATCGDRIVPAFSEAFDRSTGLQLEHLRPDKVVVFGKGAYEKLQEIGTCSWDVRYMQQRNYRDAPSLREWLDP